MIVKVCAGSSKVAAPVLKMARLFSLMMHVASAAGDPRALAMASAYSLLLILPNLLLILTAGTGGVANCLAPLQQSKSLGPVFSRMDVLCWDSVDLLQGPLGAKLEKESENEFPGPLGPGAQKVQNELKRSQNRQFFDYFDSFSTPFWTFWAPALRGARNSFSDSSF